MDLDFSELMQLISVIGLLALIFFILILITFIPVNNTYSGMIEQTFNQLIIIFVGLISIKLGLRVGKQIPAPDTCENVSDEDK
jgi:hypothetical protein